MFLFRRTAGRKDLEGAHAWQRVSEREDASHFMLCIAIAEMNECMR